MAFNLGPALLFVPADRPDFYSKGSVAADAVILDLEDAVAPHNRVSARESLLQVPLDPSSTIIRINATTTEDFALDLKALSGTKYRYVMLPKSESAEQFEALSGYDVIALCESPLGILNSSGIASCKNVIALMWGAADLVASMGGISSRHTSGQYRHVALQARSTVLLAAHARGKGAIDTVFFNIGDLSGLLEEAKDAAAIGFSASACIHPSQVSVIREAFIPSQTEISFALDLLDAASRQHGVFRFRDHMVDGPVIAHAKEILRRAGLK